MTIPLPDPFDKLCVPRGFDDPWERQQHVVQETLHQLAPRTPDGGRQVLWRCPACGQPWFEASACQVEQFLSPTRLTTLAFLFDVQRDTLGSSLPPALCPSCSIRLIGGVLRVEETVAVQGYRFIWRTEQSIAIFQMLIPGAPIHDLEALKGVLLRQPTDSLPWDAFLAILLRLLLALPTPSLREVHPFERHHLTWAADRLSALGGQGFLQGAFWHPSIPAVGEAAPLLAVQVQIPRCQALDPLAQFACWQERFATLVRAL